MRELGRKYLKVDDEQLGELKNDPRVLEEFDHLGEFILEDQQVSVVGIPALIASLFTSIWLWLYAGAGFLLKTARRFDIGFQWFNRKCDIENRPLSAIGLIAGALLAVLWWIVVLVRWAVT